MDSSDTKFKACYNLYWTILFKVIKVAKKKKNIMLQ